MDLLAEILASPEDDAPRRVYADWLIERGDPRGELIAVQLELAQTPGDRVLEARAKELLDEHGEAWLDEVGLEPAHLELGTRFVRGFVEAVAFTHGNIPDFARLARAPLRSIAHLHAHPGSLAELVAHRGLLERVDRLVIAGDDRVPRAPLVPTIAGLGPLPRLRELDITYVADDAATLAASGVLAGLARFGYRRTADCADGVAPLLAALPRDLRGLDLAYSYAIEDCLDGLPERFPTLECLRLDNCHIFDGVLADVLRRARHLREIAFRTYLSRSGSAAQFDAIAGSAYVGRLETLDLTDFNALDDGEISEYTAAALERLLARMSDARTLGFASVRLGDRGAEAFRALASDVDELDLSYTDIGPAGLAALLANPRIAHVRSLDLGGNPLGDDGIAILAATPFTRLASLGLDFIELGDRGAQALAAAPWPHLEELSIAGLDDAGLRARFGQVVR